MPLARRIRRNVAHRGLVCSGCLVGIVAARSTVAASSDLLASVTLLEMSVVRKVVADNHFDLVDGVSRTQLVIFLQNLWALGEHDVLIVIVGRGRRCLGGVHVVVDELVTASLGTVLEKLEIEMPQLSSHSDGNAHELADRLVELLVGLICHAVAPDETKSVDYLVGLGGGVSLDPGVESWCGLDYAAHSRNASVHERTLDSPLFRFLLGSAAGDVSHPSAQEGLGVRRWCVVQHWSGEDHFVNKAPDHAVHKCWLHYGRLADQDVDPIVIDVVCCQVDQSSHALVSGIDAESNVLANNQFDLVIDVVELQTETGQHLSQTVDLCTWASYQFLVRLLIETYAAIGRTAEDCI